MHLALSGGQEELSGADLLQILQQVGSFFVDCRLHACFHTNLAHPQAYAESLLSGTGGIGIYKTFTHIDVRTVKSRWNG